MATRNDRRAGVEKLGRLIKGIRFAMLTTAEADGSLRSRPMATQRAAFDGVLWFFTRESCHKVDDIESNPHVNVAYADPEDQTYVSVSGTARLVKDPAQMKQLWSPAYKAWFPEGLKDPDVTLLRVDVTEAEYWDASSSAMVYLAGLAKAAEHRKVRRASRSTPGRIVSGEDEWPSPTGFPARPRAKTWL